MFRTHTLTIHREVSRKVSEDMKKLEWELLNRDAALALYKELQSRPPCTVQIDSNWWHEYGHDVLQVRLHITPVTFRNVEVLRGAQMSYAHEVKSKPCWLRRLLKGWKE